MYDILGIARSATAAEIKTAYRKSSLANHADRIKECDKEKATEKMALTNQANNVLSDPAKRTHYDRTGELLKDRD